MLGLEATDEERELKRAYARRLKLTHPEDDPEGFQELRAAYDMAQRYQWHRRQEAFHAEMEALEAADAEAAEGGEEIRPPEPPSEPEPTPVVEIVQPLPDRPMTDEERFNAAFQAEVDALHEDVAAMREMLAAKPMPSITVREKFEAILASPALDNLGVAGNFEPWIEQVLIAEAPASDLLIPVAIDHFRWRVDEDARYRRVGDMALAREADLHVLRQLGRRSHSQYKPYKALTTPPTRWNRLRWQAEPGLEERVMVLLDGIRDSRPGLVQNLNAEAVAWWDATASRPRIGLVAATAFLVMPFLVLLAVAPGEVSGWWPLSLLLSGAISGAYFYGVVRSRIAWLAGKGEGAAAWKRYGWAGLGLSLPALGAVAVVSGIDLSIGALLLWGVGLVASGWARVTGEPAFPAPIQRTVALVGFQRTVRGMLRFGYLLAMWVIASLYAGDERWLLMLVAGAASTLVFLTGGGSLQAIVERIEPKGRAPYYVPVATGVLILAVACAAASRVPELTPWLGAMVGAVALLDVVLDRVLSEDQLTRRAWLSAALLPGVWMVNSMMHGIDTVPMGVFGSWILMQSVMTLWQASRRDSGKSELSGL
ncbi:hypothetical protein [Caulobacter sp. NIBR1757]|uniref:hypothetical protein n=1 Tax=Caulobacter sp. NIBR1757 TaxID=3016000 RepID=UPI0022F0462C|nr:hypothetical protein [Caulobacter sp. NIBR1757]